MSPYARIGNANAKRHGLSHSPEYKAWENARSRCTNPNNRKFNIYGARGISMCEAWATSFQNFIDDMGLRPTPQHTLERKDSNGNYEPGNCEWATRKTQNRNRPSYNRMVTFSGQLMTVAEAAERTGLAHSTILYRLDRGKSDEEACRK